jgi:hypothetical protein
MRSRRHRVVLAVVAALTAPSVRAWAGGGAATDSFEGIQAGPAVDVHGMADLYAQGSFNHPASGATQLRAFDTVANSASLGAVRITAAHVPSPVGFRLDAAVGDLADGYLRSDPAQFRYATSSRAFSYLEQAYVAASAPTGKEQSLSLELGKFGTPVGLEDNEAYLNWNYSRSFLYLLSEPTYHTGARLTYAACRELAFSGFWVNGWDTNLLDGNGMRTFAGAVTWDPTPRVELVVDYMGGPERRPTRLDDPTLSMRHVLDGYATVDLTDRVAFAVTADYGHDAWGGGASFGGVAGSVRVRPTDWLAASVRGEHYEDPGGLTSGARQRLAEVTTTLEGRMALGALVGMLRLEYRRDQSDARFFAVGAAQGASARQDTLTLALLTAF